jgi:hypothetical protein
VMWSSPSDGFRFDVLPVFVCSSRVWLHWLSAMEAIDPEVNSFCAPCFYPLNLLANRRCCQWNLVIRQINTDVCSFCLASDDIVV